MTITITNLTVADNAPTGTVIGVLTAKQGATVIPCTFKLQSDPNNYFAISGNSLVTAQKGSMALGPYSVNIEARPIPLSLNSAIFTIVVGAPPPTPTAIKFTPTAASLPDNAAAGIVVGAVSVSMSDGSAFAGGLAASPVGTVTISGNNLTLARGLTAADDGYHQWGITASQNGVTVLGAFQVLVIAPIPTPSGRQLTTDDGSANLTSDGSSAFLMAS